MEQNTSGRVVISVLVVLGWFFGLGLKLFAGCVQKCIKMYQNVSKSIKMCFLCPLRPSAMFLISVVSVLTVLVVLGCSLF